MERDREWSDQAQELKSCARQGRGYQKSMEVIDFQGPLVVIGHEKRELRYVSIHHAFRETIMQNTK